MLNKNERASDSLIPNFLEKQEKSMQNNITEKVLALILATDVPVSRDELLGGARLVHPVLAAIKRELGAVVPHRDPDLHAQARRLGEAPLEARQPRTVLHRVVRQRRRAYHL